MPATTTDKSAERHAEAARFGLSHVGSPAPILVADQTEPLTNTLTDSGLITLPALGLYGEALRDRSLDSKSKWKDNDLIDLLYLTCATGYADHVVCEKNSTTILRQGARRLKRVVSIHRTLADLIATLPEE